MSDAQEPLPGFDLPLGRRVELPGRGTTFVREVPGPSPDSPTVVLLHGWIASGGTNWYRAFGPLGERYRVLAPDLRGHGRGLRGQGRFRLADCADDVAALLDELDVPSAVVVGYSMGGPVGQLLWHRHPDRVDGLVLCATSHSFVPRTRDRLVFTSAMAAAAGTTRVGGAVASVPASWVRQRLPVASGGRPGSVQRWAAAEMRRHDWRMVLEAGHAIGRYDARWWIGHVDVPAAVLLTARDRAVLPERQEAMAEALPNATVHRIEHGHTVCATDAFVAPLVEACADVVARAYPTP